MKKSIEVKLLENGCVVCINRFADKNGYFTIKRNGKAHRLHRYIWEKNYGIIPQGLVVRHKCNNPSCINLQHLELGTVQDNANDTVKAGHQIKGSSINTAKLTENDVLKIRELVSLGNTQVSVAKLYNISDGQVYNIVKRKSWKHI